MNIGVKGFSGNSKSGQNFVLEGKTWICPKDGLGEALRLTRRALRAQTGPWMWAGSRNFQQIPEFQQPLQAGGEAQQVRGP